MAPDLDRLGNLLVLYGMNLLAALLIALIGWWVARLSERLTLRVLAASRADPTVAGFLSSFARYAVLVVAALIVLQVIGIQATSLVAVLGAASLAIGLALQGTLSNMAAGVMLLIFRPFRVGDSIEVAGKSGTVKNLNLFMTELAGGDNVQVLIPNGQIWGAPLTNFSTYPTRRVNVTFVIPLDRDVEAIASELRNHLNEDKRVHQSPPPAVVSSNLTDKGAELTVAAWTNADDAASVRADFVAHLLAAVRIDGAR